nr:cache domain-containing protein [Aromatoleum diolicum]
MLVPLAIGMALLLTTFLVAESLREQQSVAATRARINTAVHEAFDLAISRDSDKLGATLKAITHNDSIRSAFVGGERNTLLRATQGLFAGLLRDHNITHFYFIGTDRRMFLRVQRPGSHGDIVERTTLMRAAETGQTAAGLELGQRGLFTLRVVEPWRDMNGVLLGYIELGMEIDHTLTQLHELTGVDLYLLVDKRHLDRPQWESGMEMLGDAKNWDLLPDRVVAGRTRRASDLLLLAHPGASRGGTALDGQHRVTADDRSVEFGSLPLTDAAGRSVGTVLLAHDITALEARQQLILTIVITTTLFVAAAMLLLANRVLDRTYSAMVHARRARAPLQESARKDSPTPH